MSKEVCKKEIYGIYFLESGTGVKVILSILMGSALFLSIPSPLYGLHDTFYSADLNYVILDRLVLESVLLSMQVGTNTTTSSHYINY